MPSMINLSYQVKPDRNGSECTVKKVIIDGRIDCVDLIVGSGHTSSIKPAEIYRIFETFPCRIAIPVRPYWREGIGSITPDPFNHLCAPMPPSVV